MPQIVVATTNLHKVEEYKQLLEGEKVDLLSLRDFPGFPGVEENGDSFTANASLKAQAASKYCDLPAFADDSGLEVEALGGRPGIYSSRYAPTDAERIAKLLGELKGEKNRRARFVCAIALAINGEVIESFEGEIRGKILDAPRGDGGFGYDPVFQPDGCDRSFGELPQEEKNKISHRADAYRKAMEFIENEMAVLDDDFE